LIRFVAIGALALLLAACQPATPDRTQSASAGCERTSTKQVEWSGGEAQDTVTARAEGPSCAQAVVTLTIRNAAGDPLWTFASTYYDMTIGGHSNEPPAVSADEADQFLASWVDVTINRSGELPEWRAGSENLGEAAEGMSYFTDLDRDTYEMLRARNLPQLCFAASVGASHCLVIDPMSQAPIVIAAYGA
jgi:hypothetical protein